MEKGPSQAGEGRPAQPESSPIRSLFHPRPRSPAKAASPGRLPPLRLPPLRLTVIGTPGRWCCPEKGAESRNRARRPPASPASRQELRKAAPVGPVPARRAPSQAGALQEGRPWFGFQTLPARNQAGPTRRWDHKSPQALSSYHGTVTVLGLPWSI